MARPLLFLVHRQGGVMTNLAIRLAIASGFASVLTFQGDQHQPRPAAASLEVLDTIAATAPEAAVMPSPAAV
ncbi:MAG TPA: hypothetical protein VI589_14780, partial [Vicinamibacteria bacterium]